MKLAMNVPAPANLKPVEELTETQRALICMMAGCEMETKAVCEGGVHKIKYGTKYPVSIQIVDGKYRVYEKKDRYQPR